MIIFLYGSDGYRLTQHKDELITRYKSKYSSGINLFSIDLSLESSIGEMNSAVRYASFFDEHKLIVCRNSFSAKNISEIIFDIIKNSKINELPEVTLLLAEDLSEKELSSKNKGLFNFLLEKARTKNFELLGQAEVKNWIREQFTARNCKISDEALLKLLDIVGSDSRLLSNEINKLTAYKITGEVTKKDVEFLVSLEVDLNIFDLTDAISRGDNKKAFELLYLNLSFGKDPYPIVALLAANFRNLMSIKDLSDKNENQASIAQKTGLHPFVVKKISANIRNFDMAYLKDKYAKLLTAEVDIKNGKKALADSLYELVLN